MASSSSLIYVSECGEDKYYSEIDEPSCEKVESETALVRAGSSSAASRLSISLAKTVQNSTNRSDNNTDNYTGNATYYSELLDSDLGSVDCDQKLTTASRPNAERNNGSFHVAPQPTPATRTNSSFHVEPQPIPATRTNSSFYLESQPTPTLTTRTNSSFYLEPQPTPTLTTRINSSFYPTPLPTPAPAARFKLARISWSVSKSL